MIAPAVVLLACLGCTTAAHDAQSTRPAPAALHGRVVDQNHAAIVHARVIARPEATGATQTTTTDNEGRFDLALGGGGYVVEIVAPGFATWSQHVDATDVSTTTVREFMLSVAPIADTVRVTAPGGYRAPATDSLTKTTTPLVDVPGSVSVVTSTLVDDQLMSSLGDVMRYVPGATAHQGENNRDEIILRGNDSSANFFVNGVRDDVQYYRDLYNVDRVEVLKGPNALVFGRGAGGGVVNRVMKDADFGPRREAILETGAFGTRRVSTDVDQIVRPGLAIRFNGVFEDSDSFRDHVGLRRDGVNPTLTFEPSPFTRLTVSYEHFYDARTADRGVPSVGGRPVNVDPSTFFGDPAQSHVHADVNLTTAMAQHQIGRLTIRDRLQIGDYDRGYQNFVPGAVSVGGTGNGASADVALTAYNNATRRLTLFNQTDFVYVRTLGITKHTLLAGIEAGREVSRNVRNTGFFADGSTSLDVPVAAPTVAVPVAFAPSATDANNRVEILTTAAYVQDQIELFHVVQILGGVRFDDFDVQFHDHRTNIDLERVDPLWSPRASVVLKPRSDVSLYGSYAVSFLPSAGDQFSSLTDVTDQLKPEQFTNGEVGAKWDPHYNLSLSAAVYRLDRTNTRSVDPNDPTRIVQTGAQRTEGIELSIAGQLTEHWMVSGGYAHQHAVVTSATAAASAGAIVGHVPRQTCSFWNRYDARDRFGIGLGIVYRSDMFAAIDDTVTLPGYVTVDGAMFWLVTKRARLQLNVQNLFNRRYFLDADSNTNISPGSPRAIRVALAVAF